MAFCNLKNKERMFEPVDKPRGETIEKYTNDITTTRPFVIVVIIHQAKSYPAEGKNTIEVRKSHKYHWIT